MSVQEDYAFAVNGPDMGMSVAAQLANEAASAIRWAAAWTAPALASKVSALFGSRGQHPPSIEGVDWMATSVWKPTARDLRELVGFAAGVASTEPISLAIHWGPRMYVGDEGPDGRWISYVDHKGRTRPDARVYAVELAYDAVPLTSSRPGDPDFLFGPQSASGWALGCRVVRDHMPATQLVRWLANAAGVDEDSLSRRTGRE